MKECLSKHEAHRMIFKDTDRNVSVFSSKTSVYILGKKRCFYFQYFGYNKDLNLNTSRIVLIYANKS